MPLETGAPTDFDDGQPPLDLTGVGIGRPRPFICGNGLDHLTTEFGEDDPATPFLVSEDGLVHLDELLLPTGQGRNAKPFPILPEHPHLLLEQCEVRSHGGRRQAEDHRHPIAAQDRASGKPAEGNEKGQDRLGDGRDRVVGEEATVEADHLFLLWVMVLPVDWLAHRD